VLPRVLQAYGGRSYKALGLWLQRALLITWLMCLPISLLWTHAEPLLLAVGQKPSIAAGAARCAGCGSSQQRPRA
jgi:MATE family multidrug resistance protein